jgi:hypothetical protein
MNRGSGLCLHPDLAGSAAKRFHPGDENRAWKAAPTTRTTLKALKLTRMRRRRDCVAPESGICTNLIIRRCITIRFKMLNYRGKMPLPLFIIENRF